MEQVFLYLFIALGIALGFFKLPEIGGQDATREAEQAAQQEEVHQVRHEGQPEEPVREPDARRDTAVDAVLPPD